MLKPHQHIAAAIAFLFLALVTIGIMSAWHHNRLLSMEEPDRLFITKTEKYEDSSWTITMVGMSSHKEFKFRKSSPWHLYHEQMVYALWNPVFGVSTFTPSENMVLCVMMAVLIGSY